MKNLSFLFLICAFTAKAQMATPKEYAVNSGIPFYEAEYQMHRYWHSIHLTNGQTVYCHKLRCDNDDYIAVFEVTEMPTGVIIQKEVMYKNEEVNYTSVLR